MKTILVILFLGLPLIVFSQVDTKLSFDKETKAIQLTLENKYNAPILLNPKSDDESKKGTYYAITLKDNNGAIIKKREVYVYHQDSSRKGDFVIGALQKQSYTLDLSTWADSAYLVEVRLHVEARNPTEKIHYINKNDITKVFLWK